MSDQADRSRARKAAAGGAEAASGAAGPDAVMHLYAAMMEGFGEFGAEFLQFVSERMAEDMKTQQALLACRDPGELMQIQQAFLRRAFDQYLMQTDRVMKKGNEMLFGAFTKAS